MRIQEGEGYLHSTLPELKSYPLRGFLKFPYATPLNAKYYTGIPDFI